AIPQASEIVILDPNTQQTPISLFALPEDIQVEQLTQIFASELRLITRQNTFGPSTLVNVSIPINGTVERLNTLPPIITPTFSPNGQRIAGLTHPDGNLMLVDPEANSHQILKFPSRVGQIMWR
ncbi:MAG: hypothetical protein CUN56_15025, partial [Phototrophicales bacterium]